MLVHPDKNPNDVERAQQAFDGMCVCVCVYMSIYVCVCVCVPMQCSVYRHVVVSVIFSMFPYQSETII